MIKEYGKTTPICTICGKEATRLTKEGLTVCRTCYNSKINKKCPICKQELETRKGKFGGYFYCWSCNKNWSPKRLWLNSK